MAKVFTLPGTGIASWALLRPPGGYPGALVSVQLRVSTGIEAPGSARRAYRAPEGSGKVFTLALQDIASWGLLVAPE